MSTNNPLFKTSLWNVIEGTPIRTCLLTGDAVVLERIAWGAGVTVWYLCLNGEALDIIAGRLRPGSVVSFYFDHRIRNTDSSTLIHEEISDVIRSNGECVVGALERDGIEIAVDFVTSIGESMEFVTDHKQSKHYFWGPFPGRDNDGVNSVTFTVPDIDGVVRQHPH
ncbi:hypothetical protein Pan181_44870 [Aeoliella mucimassa]|uniref:Uncharacterized protein n=1 Tax=Aeoliella mucimassa TaxID=2527972 RepID=A0A518AU46_9BACT|nr:hypothetical protein Pan181_44870 [Aeoliella mucimassa]